MCLNGDLSRVCSSIDSSTPTAACDFDHQQFIDVMLIGPCRWTWLSSRSQTLSTTETSCDSRLSERAITTSLPARAAAMAGPWCRHSSTAKRGRPLTVTDLWSLKMSRAPRTPSLTGGEWRVKVVTSLSGHELSILNLLSIDYRLDGLEFF